MPAIACEDLWMVFGDDAGRLLERAQRESDDNLEEVSARLRAQDLVPAVRGVSFEVSRGELFVIMGLSGSGKSTVVRCVSRLLEPTAGRVSVLGEDILGASRRQLARMRRERIGMVFQHFGLFPHMTVTENVAFPLRVQGVDLAERTRRADEVIELVGLDGRQTAYPRELSGGQRQRVGIARSLAVNPDIWLLDEPFSALDPLIRRQLQDEFLALQGKLAKSIVFITHDIGEAIKVADRIAIMRDGVIVQVGTPAEIVLSPVDDYIAEFSREVARGRLMTVECLVETSSEAPSPIDGTAAALPVSMTLEAALARCVENSSASAIPVADGDGRVIGTIDPTALARAVVGDRP